MTDPASRQKPFIAWQSMLQLVLKAHALQADPAMQFAAAVMTEGNSATRAESRDHLQRAKAHAADDRTLAINISKHFQ